jgi:hypothetical protein
MDDRQQEGEVADVGGTGRAVRVSWHDVDAQRAHRLPEPLGEHHVVAAFRVERAGLADRRVGPGGQRRALRRVADPHDQFRHRLRGAVPHVQVDRGVRRHDVRGLPAVGDDAVQPNGGWDELPQRVERVDEQLGAGQRASPKPRRDRGVRAHAGEGDAQVRGGEPGASGQRPVAGMEHHRRVHPVEDPGVGEPDLARATHLLTGRADDGDRARMAGQRAGHRDRRRGGPGRDEVVAAAVPDAGQRVVLREHGDTRAGPFSLVRGDERGLHPTDR